MLCHLKMEEEIRPDGTRWLTYTDPDLPENWIEDPCTFCGGESFAAQCPGDGAHHRHGAIHLPDHSGYGYLCRAPECIVQAELAWTMARNDGRWPKKSSV